MIPAMIASLRHFLGWMVSAFRSHEDLVLENLALRRQLLALRAQQPRRRLTALHRLFWVTLRTFWSGWTKPLILVTPRTVVNWHHAGFRLYWAWVSKVRKVGGRKRVGKEIRALIFRIVAENPTWGAPRISTTLQIQESIPGPRAEWLASIGNRLLAQWDSLFCAEYAVFREWQWNRQRQRAAIRQRDCRCTAL